MYHVLEKAPAVYRARCTGVVLEKCREGGSVENCRISDFPDEVGSFVDHRPSVSHRPPGSRPPRRMPSCRRSVVLYVQVQRSTCDSTYNAMVDRSTTNVTTRKSQARAALYWSPRLQSPRIAQVRARKPPSSYHAPAGRNRGAIGHWWWWHGGMVDGMVAVGGDGDDGEDPTHA